MAAGGPRAVRARVGPDSDGRARGREWAARSAANLGSRRRRARAAERAGSLQDRQEAAAPAIAALVAGRCPSPVERLRRNTALHAATPPPRGVCFASAPELRLAQKGPRMLETAPFCGFHITDGSRPPLRADAPEFRTGLALATPPSPIILSHSLQCIRSLRREPLSLGPSDALALGHSVGDVDAGDGARFDEGGVAAEGPPVSSVTMSPGIAPEFPGGLTRSEDATKCSCLLCLCMQARASGTFEYLDDGAERVICPVCERPFALVVEDDLVGADPEYVCDVCAKDIESESFLVCNRCDQALCDDCRWDSGHGLT